MPTYGKNNFKESNVNYLNKDFASLKSSLINYAKSYFPDTYRDFNETSPGMMLLEMNAYVGDVLSFYIDQQYREMLLPLAEERRNIITMAKMFGYKVKPIVPAYVDLTFKSEVNAADDKSKVDYSDAGAFDVGVEVPSSTDSNIIFSTIEPIDFTITGSEPADTSVIKTTNADSGLAETYMLERTVRAVSGKQKTKTFQIGVPEKFKRITIPDTNVIDIISCVDSNGSNWYEVDFLAQDQVPISKHWTDEGRTSAYQNLETQTIEDLAVPYSLSYIHTPKRFVRETNTDNTTSLVFGNGVLKNGIDGVDQGYIDMEQVGIVVPGQTNDLNQSINPLLGNEYSTLGETPNNTTLTVTYRVGGGITSNVNAGMLTTKPSPTSIGNNTDAEIESVTNSTPARGGKDEEDSIEIREKAKAFFSTQNRCVTKEDYEARVLNIPGKYGNIAKAYVSRNAEYGEETFNETEFQGTLETLSQKFTDYSTDFNAEIINITEAILTGEPVNITVLNGLIEVHNQLQGTAEYEGQGVQDIEIPTLNELASVNWVHLASINIYVLAYNNKKQLTGNPHIEDTVATGGVYDNLPKTLTSNISSYLQNFKLMTDVITINDGYVVNFGVFFDVIAEKYADKQQVKLNCIQTIKDYFNINKMQFNQPIYKSNLEFELMGVEGVRSIGHVTITQETDYFFDTPTTDNEITPTYTYSYDSNHNGGEGAYVTADGGTTGYGYKYDFKNALSDDGTIIRPPLPTTPAVFELKNPNQNIQGRVR